MKRGMWVAAATAVVLCAACGGGNSKADSEQVAGAIIGPNGGELRLGKLVLEVPAGALAEETQLAVRVIEPSFEGYEVVGPAHEFWPPGLTFASPARLRFELAKEVEGAALYRGETLDDPIERVEATIEGRQVEAQLHGFSFYVVLKASGGGGGNGEFVLDGARYSSLPVSSGEIDGFSHSSAAALAIHDGDPEGGNGHVWYASNHCVTFRPDGTGLFDPKGGTSANPRLMLPWSKVDPMPGASGWVPPIPHADPAGTDLLDPSYDRRSELRKFRWGVRLDDDGTIYEDTRGNYIYGFVFEDDGLPPLSTLSWHKEDGPGGVGLGVLSTQPPEKAHHCYFYEHVSPTNPFVPERCVESEITYLGTPAFVRACYSAGLISGDYRLFLRGESAGDETDLIVGQFEKGRPTGNWTFRGPGGEWVASGSYGELGLAQGRWELYLEGRLDEVVTFSPELKDSPVGHFRVRDGAYEDWNFDWSASEVFLAEDGRLREDKRDGVWRRYETDGCVKEEMKYDFEQQKVTAEVCWSVEGERVCVDQTESVLVEQRRFLWDYCPGTHLLEVLHRDRDGKVTMTECFELSGTCREPEVGGKRECPTATCQ